MTQLFTGAIQIPGSQVEGLFRVKGPKGASLGSFVASCSQLARKSPSTRNFSGSKHGFYARHSVNNL